MTKEISIKYNIGDKIIYEFDDEGVVDDIKEGNVRGVKTKYFLIGGNCHGSIVPNTDRNIRISKFVKYLWDDLRLIRGMSISTIKGVYLTYWISMCNTEDDGLYQAVKKDLNIFHEALFLKCDLLRKETLFDLLLFEQK